MGKSKIEWTEETWNPVKGCVRISPGCARCYALTFAERFRGVVLPSGKRHAYFNGFDPRVAPEHLFSPLLWKQPRKVFVNSMSDLFLDEFPFEYIAAVFGVMAATPEHTYQVLTKRPARMVEFFRWMRHAGNRTHACFAALQAETREVGDRGPMHCGRGADPDGPWPLPNVHLGVTVENQRWTERIALLLQCPAVVHFLSCEPLLGPVVIAPAELTRLQWIICGGESGLGARTMELDWARALRDQCKSAGVAYFLKQLGGERQKRGGLLAVLDGQRHVEHP